MDTGFSLICGNGPTRLRLWPVGEEQAAPNVSQIVEYLNYNRIDYNPAAIKEALGNLSGEMEVEINSETILPIRESVIIDTTPDGLVCTGRFMPPSEGGERMDADEIMGDLKYNGIIFGILKEAVEAQCANPVYFDEVELARGIDCVPGQDAYVEYLFNTDLKARPTLKEDGTVDFFNLNIINHVNAGDKLAILHPEQPGKLGKDVKGARVKPWEVKRKRLKFGKNISLSDDGLEIFSDVDGHVSLVGGQVFVSNVLEVENVDTSTGNIEYEGNVQVNGNVFTNFSIHANGNVEVRGVVEGAEIVAGGNITIARGMNGMSKGKLKAGGNIIAQFIENASVEAAGYVESGDLIHSDVLAGTEVRVNGRRGLLSGGKVSATTLVETKMLGSEMGTETTVEIGISPTVKRRHKEIADKLAEIDKTLDRAVPIMEAAIEKREAGNELSPEQFASVKGLTQIVISKRKERNALVSEQEEIEILLQDEKSASVVVKDTVYPGVKIVITDVSKHIKDRYKFCRFVKERGDVKMTGMN